MRKLKLVASAAVLLVCAPAYSQNEGDASAADPLVEHYAQTYRVSAAEAASRLARLSDISAV
jgi:hypothetical protein